MLNDTSVREVRKSRQPRRRKSGPEFQVGQQLTINASPWGGTAKTVQVMIEKITTVDFTNIRPDLPPSYLYGLRHIGDQWTRYTVMYQGELKRRVMEVQS